MRFEQNATFSNVHQPEHERLMRNNWDQKGNWKDFFKNDNPITLELACGKGEYTLALARMFPERNFIGIDIKGARIWRGAKTALEEEMDNVAFLRCRLEFIQSCFASNEVSEIWITFPDPQKHKSRAKKRLTHPEFLDRYRKILTPDATINLKTDSSSLYDFTMDVILDQQLKVSHQTIDVYRLGKEKFSDQLNEILDNQTFYENRWLSEGKTIKYIQFKP